jgi:SAM-dependent methyltransferase
MIKCAKPQIGSTCRDRAWMLSAMIPTHLDLRGTPGPAMSPLVEIVVPEFTSHGDLVFDPFAASGSTIDVARRLGRRGLGVEILPELVAEARERLGDGAVMGGDSRRIDSLDLPPVDLVVTSPPFMTLTDHPQNPLSGYQTLDGDYAAYMKELVGITAALARLVRPGGRIVFNVWNFHHHGEYTPLADDLQAALAQETGLVGVLQLEQRVEVHWDETVDAPDDDICLVYRTSGVASRV